MGVTRSRFCKDPDCTGPEHHAFRSDETVTASEGIVLPGWQCMARVTTFGLAPEHRWSLRTVCNSFNSDAKERLTHCRVCGAPRPLPDDAQPGDEETGSPR